MGLVGHSPWGHKEFDMIEGLSKASAYNSGDPGSIPGLGRSPGEGNGNPLHILAWEIPWTGPWQAAVHGVTKESDMT